MLYCCSLLSEPELRMSVIVERSARSATKKASALFGLRWRDSILIGDMAL